MRCGIVLCIYVHVCPDGWASVFTCAVHVTEAEKDGAGERGRERVYRVIDLHPPDAWSFGNDPSAV